MSRAASSHRISRGCVLTPTSFGATSSHTHQSWLRQSHNHTSREDVPVPTPAVVASSDPHHTSRGGLVIITCVVLASSNQHQSGWRPRTHIGRGVVLIPTLVGVVASRPHPTGTSLHSNCYRSGVLYRHQSMLRPQADVVLAARQSCWGPSVATSLFVALLLFEVSDDGLEHKPQPRRSSEGRPVREGREGC